MVGEGQYYYWEIHFTVRANWLEDKPHKQTRLIKAEDNTQKDKERAIKEFWDNYGFGWDENHDVSVIEARFIITSRWMNGMFD